MIIFIKNDPTYEAPPSCGGNEENMTSPKNKGFTGCKESVKADGTGWGCK